MESKNVRHVLDRDVLGSKLANDSLELGPQRSLRVSQASPLPGCGCALAREATDDRFDRFEVVGADGSDIIENRDSWPPSGEVLASPLVALDEPGMLNSGLFKADVEEPGSREKRSTDHVLRLHTSSCAASSATASSCRTRSGPHTPHAHPA